MFLSVKRVCLIVFPIASRDFVTKLDIKKDYEEIDTRLASGWYVDDSYVSKKKIYKTKKTPFKISKKINS